MMQEYHKIQTVWHRDPANKMKTLIENKWTLPEFDYLSWSTWIATEKIDGTNIRVMWDGEKVRFGGRTERSNIPTKLLSYLQDTFTKEKMESCLGNTPACIYGEGYGEKIQPYGEQYLPGHNSFIAFDIQIYGYFLDRDKLEGICSNIGIECVPIIAHKITLVEAIELVKEGFKSRISTTPTLIAEGLILVPSVPLFTNSGKRIITKIKHKDFNFIKDEINNKDQILGES